MTIIINLFKNYIFQIHLHSKIIILIHNKISKILLKIKNVVKFVAELISLKVKM